MGDGMDELGCKACVWQDVREAEELAIADMGDEDDGD